MEIVSLILIENVTIFWIGRVDLGILTENTLEFRGFFNAIRAVII
ncbi:hypothetical protein P9D31_04855 [Bacillus haynesii]|nr:hypothetical protein [Bacillus haynesii]MEC1471692.1 hypothetical protein [Bacillus haynesii]